MTVTIDPAWKIEPVHQAGLAWFDAHKGQIVSWREIYAHADVAARLVNTAKGIYKPHYTDYALSVRVLQEGPYPDKEVEYRKDGSWVVQYFQENPDILMRDREATNRGLLKCMADGVPVGFLIKRRPKPNVAYEVLGLGLVTKWDSGYFTIEGFAEDGSAREAVILPDAAATRVAFGTNDEPQWNDFDAKSDVDLRIRVVQLVARRLGQQRFRRQLLKAYAGKCCLTGACFVETLEAAHISPYRGEQSNHPQNGLLLRGDLHTLFDLGHLGFDDQFRVLLSPRAGESDEYRQLAGREIMLPATKSNWPSEEALRRHRMWAGL